VDTDLQPKRLCAVLTCFNRRDVTLRGLEALRASAEAAGVELHGVLVDDASTDGTAAAVRAQAPWAEVLVSEGDLYWCRGMHIACGHAFQQGHDHYLWLNDDTLLDRDALSRLLACQARLLGREGDPLIVVGSTRDSRNGKNTYGGKRRGNWWPTRFARVEPTLAAQRIETFDGNIVLLTRAAALRAGNLDPSFEHAMGDIDYGLRANRQDVPTWLAPGTHGLCNDNPQTGTYLDPALPWRRRWTLMCGRKGLPLRSWLIFNRRHSGPLWLATFAWPYVRLALEGLWGRRGDAS
jgi:GT2 family glycosyltransferase